MKNQYLECLDLQPAVLNFQSLDWKVNAVEPIVLGKCLEIGQLVCSSMNKVSLTNAELVSNLRRLRQDWYAAVLIPWVKTAPSVNMFPDSGIDSGRTAATLVCLPASDVLMTSCSTCEIWTSRTIKDLAC